MKIFTAVVVLGLIASAASAQLTPFEHSADKKYTATCQEVISYYRQPGLILFTATPATPKKPIFAILWGDC